MTPEQAAAVTAVTQLVLRERHSRDRGQYDDMRECYADDSVVEMSWFHGPGPEFVRRSQAMAESPDGWGGRSAHRLSPALVSVHGERALAVLPLAIEFRIDVDGVEADLVSSCRNLYRAAATDGEWHIARLTSIYERDTLTASIPGTHLTIDPARLTDLRPSYRCLAWFLRQRGIAVPADLLGDDQPAAVGEQVEREQAWLAGE